MARFILVLLVLVCPVRAGKFIPPEKATRTATLPKRTCVVDAAQLEPFGSRRPIKIALISQSRMPESYRLKDRSEGCEASTIL